MSDSAQAVEELISRGRSIDSSELRMSIFEEAVRLAEPLGDLELLFEAKVLYGISASFVGKSEKTFATFAWCSSHYEKSPERFQPWKYEYHWGFKLILHNAGIFPEISLEQIDQLWNQLKISFRQSGYGERSVYYLYFCHLLSVGKIEQAGKLIPKWMSEKRDSMDDCVACEKGRLADYYGLIDDYERSLETAQPVLDGNFTCGSQPNNTIPFLLRSYAMLDRYEEGDRVQARGYRLIKNDPDSLGSIGDHMIYLMHRGRLRAATNMIERHLSLALKTREPSVKYFFFIAAQLLLQRLAEKKKTYKFAFVNEFPLHNSSHEYHVDTLIAWFGEQSRELGERFDNRNGNDFYTKRMVEMMNY